MHHRGTGEDDHELLDLAYHIAVLRGTNVDQPRNLARA